MRGTNIRAKKRREQLKTAAQKQAGRKTGKTKNRE
jgi:hypothetical protein